MMIVMNAMMTMMMTMTTNMMMSYLRVVSYSSTGQRGP